MSDSDPSDAPSAAVPPDAELEKALRSQVVKFLSAGKDVTVNAVRTAAEQKLGLSGGFYMGDKKWKAESKRIILEQHDIQSQLPSSPVKQEPPAKAPKKGQKRSSPSTAGAPRKRQKQESPVVSESEGESSVLSDAPTDEPEEPKELKEPAQATTKPPKVKMAASAKEESDSELSVLLDEEPQPKKRKSKGSGKDASNKPKAKPKTDTNQDANQEEIKKLQGWLVKCGVRKIWGKELKPYDTPKEKIKHLKGMLADAGMTGRFSEEKARQLKDARELAADIEAVKEGNEMWGKTSGDEDEKADDDVPKRRLVRGAKNYDFLSSDGEETD